MRRPSCCLAGVGAYLSQARGKTTGQISWFLLTRGLWLIVLELTVSRWGLTFNLHYGGFAWLLVLWSLGCAMICLAGLVHLPRWAIGAICFAMIFGHNAFDGVRAQNLGHLGPAWIVLHQPAPIPMFGGVLFDGYPLIPWIAVIGIGYLLGALLIEPQKQRRQKLILSGAVVTAAFIVLRFINVYGDPNPWKAQGTAIMTLCSFLNLTKQPPSLLYLAMTLGPVLIALAYFDRSLPRWTKPLIIYGRVPLFFYLLNFPVPHILGIALAAATGQDWRHFFSATGPFEQPPAGFGHGLGMTYLAWLIGLVILYPLCAWFAGVKRRNKAAWLSYL